MLKSITLENYKAFKDETEIEVAPLTVLCGVNSSGKSSILKSLLMMKQTVEKDTPYNHLSFIGNYVDNGYWDDIINSEAQNAKGNNATFTITNKFLLKNFNGVENRQDILSYKQLKKLYYFEKNIHSFEITHSVEIKKVLDKEKKENVNNLLKYINNNRVIKTKIEIKLYNSKGKELLNEPSYVEINNVSNDNLKYTLSYRNLPYNGEYYSNYKKERYNCYFNNIKLTNFYKENINPDVVQIKSTILSFFDIVSRQYNGVDYIAPLRQAPLRNYVIKGEVDSVGIYGEDMPVLLAKLQGNDHIIDIPMPFSKTDNIFNIIGNNKIEEDKVTFLDYVQDWMNYFELGKIEVSGDFGLMSIKINGHNITDVGFGVSQVLPIIIQGLHMQKDATLLLEQPEIHLHPKMQMNMADFLIAVASSERNVIVETHSEHIINRLVRRVLEDETRTLSNKIKIYFVEQIVADCGEKTSLTYIPINDEYGIQSYPTNFFDQTANEQLQIMRSGLLKRDKIKNNII